jgi:hypothetical protein
VLHHSKSQFSVDSHQTDPKCRGNSVETLSRSFVLRSVTSALRNCQCYSMRPLSLGTGREVLGSLCSLVLGAWGPGVCVYVRVHLPPPSEKETAFFHRPFIPFL